MDEIVKANDLHRRELLELVPVDVQVPYALHLFLLLRLRYDLLDCLVQNVVRVPVDHVALALVVTVFRQNVFVS